MVKLDAEEDDGGHQEVCTRNLYLHGGTGLEVLLNVL